MDWYIVRPITDRTQFRGDHQPCRFRASWRDTEQLLRREIEFLDGRDVFLEVDVRPGDVRNDGRLRANARPVSGAVRLVFDSTYGPLSYGTDTYDNGRVEDWQDNVRAIALGLQSLRAVDRYGVTRRGEQYVGFKALTDGRDAAGMSRTTARELLARHAGYTVPGARADSVLFRDARTHVHPDRNGGAREAWDQVESAGRALGLI